MIVGVIQSFCQFSMHLGTVNTFGEILKQYYLQSLETILF